jgi:hypothetical protein
MLRSALAWGSLLLAALRPAKRVRPLHYRGIRKRKSAMLLRSGIAACAITHPTKNKE